MLTLRTHMKDNLLFLKGHHVDFHQTFLVQVIHREILKVFFFFRSLLVILHDTYILIVNVPIIYKTNFIQTFFFYFCPNYFKGCHHPSLYIDNPDEDDEGNSGDIRGNKEGPDHSCVIAPL